MRVSAGFAAIGFAVLVAACGGGDDEQARKADHAPRGGTLRIGINYETLSTIDPARIDFDPAITELQRCCLLRTLVNYRGATTEDGGSVLRPDLAEALPKVSKDGLTYTFRLRPGLRYAPPYEHVTIKAQDVVRAIEYAVRLESASETNYMLVIEGAREFQNGTADTVSGLETPDDRTLVVHLAERVGDLAERFSFAITAPVPSGTDVGDKQIGRVPVSSGPYMIAGSGGFDFSRAPTKPGLPSGYVVKKRMTLVRNPAWRRDLLRAAYVNRIVVTFEAGPADKAAAKVDQGRLDVALGQFVPTTEQVRRYSADPALEKRLFAHVGNVVRYISLNVAVPPFDDVHVRKAVNLAIDKQALRRTARDGRGGRIAGHIAPDALLNNLLLDYDPYETPGGRGDLEAAQGEMAKSRYDRDRDGVCDAPACSGLLAPVRNDDPAIRRLGNIVADNLRPIGIKLDVKAFDPDTYFGEVINPPSRVPVIPALGVVGDTLNGAGVFPGLFYGPLIGGPTGASSLVGASPQQLRNWKYTVTNVPNVDGKIEECLRLTAGAQIQCWAETDQLLMEKVVPWVPYLFEGGTQVVSNRVSRFTFSQSSFFMPAFDQIALKPGSG